MMKKNIEGFSSKNHFVTFEQGAEITTDNIRKGIKSGFVA